MTPPQEARLLVDLDALAANYDALAREARGAEVAPVVKADAYGLGLAPVARRLWAKGARRFFVARLSEGVALREALQPRRPADVWLLDGCPPGAAAELCAHDLSPVLNSLDQLHAWGEHARSVGRALPAALHVDTGLNRLGLVPEEACELAQSDALRAFALAFMMSHLACADRPDDPMNAAQAARFAAIAARFPGLPTSLAATAGVFLGPRFHGDIVRPGIGLVGGGPFGRPDARIRPVATLEAPVLQVRRVEAGESVGYGASFRAERPMQLAIAAIGYADGVLRAADRPRYGWLMGARRAIVGRISMDLVALDATGCDVAPGARVQLYGPELPIDEAAAAAGTIAFELLTGIAPRVRRVYAGEEA